MSLPPVANDDASAAAALVAHAATLTAAYGRGATNRDATSVSAINAACLYD